MNAKFTIAASALCGMLLGFPAAQAQELPDIKKIRIEIGLTEHDFTTFPERLTLKAGEPYRLEFVNWSEGIRHVVMAPELAGAVLTTAIRSLPHRVDMTGAGFDTGITLAPSGGRVEVYFVPVREGRYKLFCQDRVHTDAGMDVTVEVRL